MLWKTCPTFFLRVDIWIFLKVIMSQVIKVQRFHNRHSLLYCPYLKQHNKLLDTRFYMQSMKRYGYVSNLHQQQAHNILGSDYVRASSPFFSLGTTLAFSLASTHFSSGMSALVGSSLSCIAFERQPCSYLQQAKNLAQFELQQHMRKLPFQPL